MRKCEFTGRFSSVHRSFGRSEFTIYVDNLPNSCGTPWFRLVFSQYGFIDETYLPNRRSKRTGNRFGFVRYRNRRDAQSAVAMANGLLFGRRSIIVEMARYDSGFKRDDSTRFGSGSQNHEISRVPNAKLPHIQDDFRAPRGKPKSIPVPQNHFHFESCQIPNMGNLKEPERKVTLNFQPTASGWLMTSAVAKLKEITTMEIVQQALEDLDFQDVSAKSLGGMDLIISFQSKEDRQAALQNPKIQGWFKSCKPWNGEPSGKSRLVWLKCRGIPLNVWSLSSFKRIGEIWGDFITLDQETLKEESYDVGRMMIATEYLNRIDEWINITVRGRNYGARIWEEDCDDPFNEKHIRDWINNHISIPETNPKSREEVTSWVSDLAEKGALDKPNLAELEAKSADKAVTEVNLTSTLLLKDGNSRIVHVPREDVIIANATAQEAEESIVGESLANINQPIGNKEQEVMHNQCVISNPDVQIMLQNVTNEAAAGDMLSSSLGVEKSAMGSGKVRGSVGERNIINSFQNISLAPLTIIELHRNMQFSRAKLSNLVDDQVSWVANSVSEKLTSTETSREEYDEDEPLLDHNVDNHIEEEPILAPIKAAINGVKGKKKRKTIDDILGFTKVNAANNKGRKNKQKCEVYRSAVAALALSASISSEGFVNRNRILLNEAQAVWACNKIIGLGYDGDEDEVVSKIAEMEAQDLDRADGAKICF